MSSEALKNDVTRTGGRPATEGLIRGRYSLSVGMPQEEPPSGWRWCALSKLARLETGHTPSRKHPEYWGGTIPWIGIRDATGHHGETIFSTQQYTNDLGIANSSARVLPANTVCLSRTASVGYVVVMGAPMATSQDFVNWVCSEAIDYRFLKYILLAEHDSMLRFASGTTHQTIYFPEAKAFHVCIPDVAEQRRIADVLQVLDDRISILRESNTTLEAIAQALFKSWFVDFDPVRAKAQGRKPDGISEEAAELFPDEFEESELGRVPKGWKVIALKELCHIASGKRPAERSDSRSPVMDVPLYGGAGVMGYTNASLFDAPKILTGRVGTLGKNHIAYPPFWVSDNVLVLSPLFGGAFIFCRHWLDEIDVHGLNRGSTQPLLTQKDLGNQRRAVPPEALLSVFSAVSETLYEKIRNNSVQVQTLTSLRDALLPRLMSGQLRIPEAEALLQDVA